MSDSEKKDREFSRSHVALSAELRTPGGLVMVGSVRDVSMKGVWVAYEKALPRGTPVKVTLLLNDGEGKHRIRTQGHVVRADINGVAVEFDEVDAESLKDLKRLVLYNAEDTDQVEDEFDSHLGLKPKPGLSD